VKTFEINNDHCFRMVNSRWQSSVKSLRMVEAITNWIL
jgi:hypothetical protein